MSNRDDKKNQGDSPLKSSSWAQKIFGEETPQEHSVSEQSSETAIDLGLGSFLESAHQPQLDKSQLEAGDSLNIDLADEPKDSQSGTQAGCLSDFEILAQKADWTALLSQTESLLENQQVRHDSSDKWVEAQAWWIITQLELKILPATVLTAPLESMLDQLVATSGSKTIDCNPESEVRMQGNRLLVKRAAAQLIERFFAQGDFLSGIQLASRVRVIGGDNSLIANVVKKYASALEALSGSEQKLYSILCKELAITRMALTKQEKGLSESTEKLDREDGPGRGNDLSRTREPASFFKLTLIILGFFSALAGAIFWFWNRQGNLVAFPSDLNKISVPTPAFEPPKPPALAKVGELDAVLYGMATKGPLPQQPSAQDSLAQSSIAGPKTLSMPTIVPVTPRAKVAVDTKGPVESPGLRDLRAKKEKEKASASDQGSSNIEVPGPAVAPRFENFQQPRVYRIRRATNLMLKPSLNSDPVAGLNKGDRIKVVGIAGYWLKVMSKQGRVAYVLSEDTEVIN